MGKICSYLSGFLASDVVRYRKGVVRTNLSHSFPDRDRTELKRLERDFYRHLAQVMGEAIRFRSYRGPKGKERLRASGICTIEEPERIRAAYAQMDGMMVLASHCGNWEMLGGWFAYAPEGALGYSERDIAVVYKRLSSPFWDRVMRRGRLGPLEGSGFDGYVESRDVLRYALEHKGEKKVFVFPTDQYPYKGAASHEIGDFLHQPTLTMGGGAALASKLGMGVSYLGFRQRPDGGYTMRFEPIVIDASQMSPEDIMSRYYELLQADIEAQPANWLWSHKRWKNIYNYKH